MTCNNSLGITVWDTLSLPFVFTAGGSLMNLTGYSVRWVLKKTVSQVVPTLQKVLVITNPTQGEARLDLSVTDTNITPGVYLWEIIITDSLGGQTTTPTQKISFFAHHNRIESVSLSGYTIQLWRNVSIEIVNKQGMSWPPWPIGGNWKWAYDPLTSYTTGDLIQYLGTSYIAKYPSIWQTPSDTSYYWDVFAKVQVFTLTGSWNTDTLENGQSCILSIPIIGISENGNNFAIVTNGSLFPQNVIYNANIRGTDSVEVYVENQSWNRINPFQVNVKVLKF